MFSEATDSNILSYFSFFELFSADEIHFVPPERPRLNLNEHLFFARYTQFELFIVIRFSLTLGTTTTHLPAAIFKIVYTEDGFCGIRANSVGAHEVWIHFCLTSFHAEWTEDNVKKLARIELNEPLLSRDFHLRGLMELMFSTRNAAIKCLHAVQWWKMPFKLRELNRECNKCFIVPRLSFHIKEVSSFCTAQLSGPT